MAVLYEIVGMLKIETNGHGALSLFGAMVILQNRKKYVSCSDETYSCPD